jgi:multidrug resistance protein EbrB
VKGYIALGIAIIGEIFGSSMLKLSEGFTNVLPSIGFILGFGVAFYSISISLMNIPLGTAYAIWSGAGTVLTALIGVWVWEEPIRVYIHFPRGGNFKKNYSVASVSSAGSGLKNPAFFFSLIR